MKNIFLLQLAFSAMLFSAGNSNAQTVSMSYNGQEMRVSKDSLAHITLFTGRCCEGKTYLHWNVKNQQRDGLYIIYRSVDGKNYEALGYKQGVGVLISAPIAYYFQDENPRAGTTYYKLVHIAKDNTYLVSEKISVARDETLLSKTK